MATSTILTIEVPPNEVSRISSILKAYGGIKIKEKKEIISNSENKITDLKSKIKEK